MRILDDQSNELKVGSQVTTWYPNSPIPPHECEGVVSKITDPDADYDDNLERGVFYPPHVTVKFYSDGEEDTFITSAVGSWLGLPEDGDYRCEDVTLIQE